MPQRPRDLHPGSSPAALFGAELRRRRTQAGLSQATLGHAVYVSGDLIAKVEKAERRPLPDLVERLDGALEANGDLVRLSSAVTEARRTVTAGGAVQAFGHATPAAGELSTALLDVLAGIRDLDHGLGSGRALAALLAHARIANALLSGLRGDERRGVLSTLAEIHQLAGWIQFDRNKLGAAQREFVLAKGYAEAGQNDALVAYVLGPSHGFALTYDGHPRAGLEHIGAALVRARSTQNRRLTGFVLAVGARALAKLGEARLCLEMLDEAEDQLNRHVPHGADPVWLEVFDDAALRGHRGSCWLDLGRPARAVDPLVEQDALAPRLFVRNRSIWLLDRAQAHVDLGEVDAACAAVEQALDVSSGTSSTRAVGRLRLVARSLEQWSSVAAVRHVRDRLRAEVAA